ncbi:hypothetical protein B0H13DRAFT_2253004 [Mycena leptocephala]|nr:hypothetical protein B0H13DRAFT_2253004 [Mycena leptocephala]
MQPHLEEFACETVADEMETRRRNSTLPGIAVVTPDFIENWSLDEDTNDTPFLTSILTAASQTERAKKQNKLKKPDKMVQVVTRQLLYQYSNRCLAFQAEFGLFLWSTGCARQTIDALFRCGLSVGYDSVLNLRGANGPAKVTSGTFGVLYGLRNAKLDHILIAPIMKRFRESTGLQFNRDIRPSIAHLKIFYDQLLITIIDCLFTYNQGFEDVAKHPTLQHKSIRPLPVGYKTPQFATRASTKEEATTRGNLQYHDELYITQLKRTPESLSKYAIPSINDQLTNSRIRSAQFLRLKDVNAWERREILQLGFGLFHLCLNLVWAILHTHRGSTNEMGSLTYFFALMEKARLGNDQPDYHSLLAALTQVLHGLLNAWSKECGFASFKLFADSKPSPAILRDIAARILDNYATPMNNSSSPESGSAEEPAASDDSSESESGSEAESTSHLNPPPAPADNPKDDVAYHNIRLLTRDLLMVTALVRAISDGDIGRVEAMLPHLAMMFRGSGCNKYCTEILHFLHNLKHVWTPEFAYGYLSS